MHVAPGQYALAESGPAGYRQTSLTCTPSGASGNTVTLASGDDVTCTFTNTALHPVVLTKVWQNALAGDSVDLTISDGTARATGTSTAPATTTNATLDALAGDTVELAETFTVGNPANYQSTLGCDNGVTVIDGAFSVAEPVAPTLTKRPLGLAQDPATGSWNVTYTVSVANPSSTTSLVYSLSDTPMFASGTRINRAAVIAAGDNAGNTISGLVNAWNGTSLSIISARNLAAGVIDACTVLINVSVTQQNPSAGQCQSDQPGNGLSNTAAARRRQDAITAHACVSLSQAVPPAPAATPPAELPFTGVPVAELLVAALALLTLGSALLLISRPRRRQHGM